MLPLNQKKSSHRSGSPVYCLTQCVATYAPDRREQVYHHQFVRIIFICFNSEAQNKGKISIIPNFITFATHIPVKDGANISAQYSFVYGDLAACYGHIRH
jgi:hypothetical protein